MKGKSVRSRGSTFDLPTQNFSVGDITLEPSELLYSGTDFTFDLDMSPITDSEDEGPLQRSLEHSGNGETY